MRPLLRIFFCHASCCLPCLLCSSRRQLVVMHCTPYCPSPPNIPTYQRRTAVCHVFQRAVSVVPRWPPPCGQGKARAQGFPVDAGSFMPRNSSPHVSPAIVGRSKVLGLSGRFVCRPGLFPPSRSASCCSRGGHDIDDGSIDGALAAPAGRMPRVTAHTPLRVDVAADAPAACVRVSVVVRHAAHHVGTRPARPSPARPTLSPPACLTSLPASPDGAAECAVDDRRGGTSYCNHIRTELL